MPGSASIRLQKIAVAPTPTPVAAKNNPSYQKFLCSCGGIATEQMTIAIWRRRAATEGVGVASAPPFSPLPSFRPF